MVKWVQIEYEMKMKSVHWLKSQQDKWMIKLKIAVLHSTIVRLLQPMNPIYNVQSVALASDFLIRKCDKNNEIKNQILSLDLVS